MGPDHDEYKAQEPSDPSDVENDGGYDYYN